MRKKIFPYLASYTLVKAIILITMSACIFYACAAFRPMHEHKITYYSANTKEGLAVEIETNLKKTGLYSKGTYLLLLGTAASESDFGRLNKQRGGPALGVFQIEPRTAKDIWNDYLRFHPKLRATVKATLWKNVDLKTQLQYNLKYQTAMAAIHYRRASEKFDYDQPDGTSVWTMAFWHKKAFNTHKGKATTTRFYKKFNEHVTPLL